MNQVCLSVCTRTKTEEYASRGTCDGNFYDEIERKWPDIVKLMDASAPTVLYLEGNLFVTGIPTRRKDEAGTPIIWSFRICAPGCSKWWPALVEAFKNRTIDALGDRLDKLCGLEGIDEDYHAPRMTEFVDLLNELYGGDNSNASAREFLLWTENSPSTEKELKSFIDGLNIPDGWVGLRDQEFPVTKNAEAAAAKAALVPDGNLNTVVLVGLIVGILVGGYWLWELCPK